MADSVIALQKGFDFQAKYFWCKACHIFVANSSIKSISYEIDKVPGFDDVAIFYEPEKLDGNGDKIKREYFQVKFHTDQSNAFTCEALMKPEFIGAVSESLLQKLHENYKCSPLDYAQSLYYLVNTWGFDRNDPIATLLNNDGAFILDRLFDNTTDRSKNGKIRKSWRDHLGLASDDDLRAIIKQLRIIHNAKTGEQLDEDMNLALSFVGLQTQDNTKRTSPYPELIRRLHSEKRNNLTKEQLKEVLEQEKLWVQTSTQSVRTIYRMGVRSFKRGTDTLELETDKYLCLLHHFEGRYVRDGDLWRTQILPALQSLSDYALTQGLPIDLHLDTHLSVAFAMGYLLDGKTGIDIGVVQKGRNGGRDVWRPNTQGVRSTDAVWQINEEPISNNGQDVVLAVSVTHDIRVAVKEFVEKALPTSAKIIHSSILPKPSGGAIHDANHIVQAVEQLVEYVMSNRTSNEKNGTLHIFMAAPNAFAFFLGRFGKRLGKIALYEYDFENLRGGSYLPGIFLP